MQAGVVVAMLLFLWIVWMLRATRENPAVLGTKANSPNDSGIPGIQSSTPATISGERTQNVSAPDIDAPRLLESLMVRHRDADRHEYDLSKGRFCRELNLGMTEGRLLALALPEVVEPLLTGIAGDTSRDAQDRLFALRLLGVLSRSGRKGAESTLMRFAYSEDRDLAGTSITELHQQDFHGSYRDVYFRGCKSGVIESFDALSRWADPENVALMKKLTLLDRETSRLPDCARRVLDSYAILQASDWQSRLSTILKDTSGLDGSQTLWALGVAQARQMPELHAALRQRLDDDFLRAQSELESTSKRLARKLGILNDQGQNAESRYSLEPLERELGNCYHDDLLIVFAASGGELRVRERTRLQRFGYQGDPKKRLQEILATSDR